MAKITLKGNEINTSGDLPAIGSQAPDFLVTKTDLSDISLTDLKGKRVILNIFPSIDTGVCAASVRHFNADAAGLDNTVILCVSRDLPFAHARFCGAEGIENVESVSELRNNSFGDNYNVRIVDGPLAGLTARAVVVLDEDAKVIYTEQVPEIGQEPNYEAALNSLS
jgi:thioredoxin-dependent peroxiredoxin